MAATTGELANAVVLDTHQTEYNNGIVFRPDPSEDTKISSSFTVRNNHPDRNIAFKIKTTAPLCYVVKPNQGIVEAQQSLPLSIVYVHNEVSYRMRADPARNAVKQEPSGQQVPDPGGLHHAER